MALDILLGLQWGDEGKGKIVDVLAPDYDIVARFQGGPNAGHTLNIKGEELVLHTIPSGIIHENVINVIGGGMVIDPTTLDEEIEKLRKKGLFDPNRLLIAKNAHLILPSHRKLDEAQENSKGGNKIGSTLKGIGPSYMDKTSRKGLRIRDIFDPDFKQKYELLKKEHLALLDRINAKGPSKNEEEEWLSGIQHLKKLNIQNTEEYLNQKLSDDAKILAEGAQGTFLDLDLGTYPYVTSSNTLAANACLGLGISPKSVNKIYGVFKAYTTRVGEGPFPTELNGQEGEILKEKGKEYGATTGRPRRCGWLDLPGLNYAIKINGVTDLIITKTDIFKGFDAIKICNGFENLAQDEGYPEIINESNTIRPRYESFKSWNSDISKIQQKTSLPEPLRNYLNFIQDHTGKKMTIISTGPRRNQYLWVQKI